MRASTSRATRKWAPGTSWVIWFHPFSLTERQIAQCKADIDIHHREHGEHGGTKWNKERGER